jgi:hypothetical protein
MKSSSKCSMFIIIIVIIINLVHRQHATLP